MKSENVEGIYGHTKIYSKTYKLCPIMTDPLNKDTSACISMDSSAMYNLTQLHKHTPILRLSNGMENGPIWEPAYQEFFPNGNIETLAGKIIGKVKGYQLNATNVAIKADDYAVNAKDEIKLNIGSRYIGIDKQSAYLHSNTLKLWESDTQLPTPDPGKIELLRYNKDKLEWTDSALQKIATWADHSKKYTRVRIARIRTKYANNNKIGEWAPSISFGVNTKEGSGIYNVEITPNPGLIVTFNMTINRTQSTDGKTSYN